MKLKLVFVFADVLFLGIVVDDVVGRCTYNNIEYKFPVSKKKKKLETQVE